MSGVEHLQGSCSCGRYIYIIHVPDDAETKSQAQVHFGTRDLDRRSHSSILSAWLKVPLQWFESTTVSFFPDERHDHIARTFEPPEQQGCQRKFCGFCGTHISYWTEQPSIERDFMNITLGSLRTKDLLALEDLDLLPSENDHTPMEEGPGQALQRDAQQTLSPTSNNGLVRSSRQGTSGSISWLEDLIEGSELGRHSKRRKGVGTSLDGTTTVSWEISEYYEQDDKSTTGTKRKAGDIETDDTAMKG